MNNISGFRDSANQEPVFHANNEINDLIKAFMRLNTEQTKPAEISKILTGVLNKQTHYQSK